MRLLRRNKKRIWIADHVEKVPNVDRNGNYTGEYELKHTDPFGINAVVSGGISYSAQEYGIHDFGTKIVLCEKEDGLKVKESSLIWIDADPNSEDANYTVEKIEVSLNHVMILCSRVSGNGKNSN